MEYNFLDNSFTVYENVHTPEVKLNMSLLDEPIDISDWASGVTEEGKIIPKDNIIVDELPRLYINFDSNPEVDVHPMNNNTPVVTNNNSVVNNSKSINKMNGNIELQITNFFISKGLTNYQAAGIVGNLKAESGLKHNIVNSIGAYGLALWLGPRKKELFRKYGTNPTIEQLLDFIWEELNTTERSAFRHLKSTKNLEDATKSFMNMFERPSLKERDESISRRIKYAKESLV